MFLKILQNSQGNTCAGISFSVKLQADIFLIFQKSVKNRADFSSGTLKKLISDMSLFRIANLQHWIFFNFLYVLSMFLIKDEVIFPFSGKKTSAVVACL